MNDVAILLLSLPLGLCSGDSEPAPRVASPYAAWVLEDAFPVTRKLLLNNTQSTAERLSKHLPERCVVEEVGGMLARPADQLGFFAASVHAEALPHTQQMIRESANPSHPFTFHIPFSR